MSVFGWWPSLAMAHLGQFLGVWLAILGLGPSKPELAVRLAPGQD